MNKGDYDLTMGQMQKNKKNSTKDHVNTKAEIAYIELSVILGHVILVL